MLIAQIAPKGFCRVDYLFLVVSTEKANQNSGNQQRVSDNRRDKDHCPNPSYSDRRIEFSDMEDVFPAWIKRLFHFPHS